MQVHGQGLTQVFLLSGDRRRRHGVDILQGELMKIKPQNFNGENMKGEEVKA
jgi:hypothetical protein